MGWLGPLQEQTAYPKPAELRARNAAKPMFVRGRFYHSMGEACRALGCEYVQMRAMIARGEAVACKPEN